MRFTRLRAKWWLPSVATISTRASRVPKTDSFRISTNLRHIMARNPVILLQLQHSKTRLSSAVGNMSTTSVEGNNQTTISKSVSPLLKALTQEPPLNVPLIQNWRAINLRSACKNISNNSSSSLARRNPNKWWSTTSTLTHVNSLSLRRKRAHTHSAAPAMATKSPVRDKAKMQPCFTSSMQLIAAVKTLTLAAIWVGSRSSPSRDTACETTKILTMMSSNTNFSNSTWLSRDR